MEFQSADISKLAEALAVAQGQMTFASKDSTAPAFDKGRGGSRKYADLASVIDAIREPLSKNGIAWSQQTMPAEASVTIRTMLFHKSGQWMAGLFNLPIDRMGGIQGMGSALTYARRYALAAIVGIAQDDDDGETAQKAFKEAEIKQARETARNSNPSPASDPQFRLMQKLVTERVGKSRDDCLNCIKRIVGREIGSSLELTKEEVSSVIDALQDNDTTEVFENVD